MFFHWYQQSLHKASEADDGPVGDIQTWSCTGPAQCLSFSDPQSGEVDADSSPTSRSFMSMTTKLYLARFTFLKITLQCIELVITQKAKQPMLHFTTQVMWGILNTNLGDRLGHCGSQCASLTSLELCDSYFQDKAMQYNR